MRLLRHTYTGILSVAALSLLIGALLPPQSAKAYTPDLQGARDWANTYCPDPSYKEDKIADYMWVTAPGGGTDISVTSGGSDQVDISINFVATYCANWPSGWTNGAKQLSVNDTSGKDRLIGGPAAVTYDDRSNAAGIGLRSERGVYQYSAKLDVSGWGTGAHPVCTGFGTTTNRPKATFSASPNACFNVNLTRIDPWSTTGVSRVGVDHDPNVSSWDATPGQWLSWNHTISNTTSYSTAQITPAVERSGFRASSGLNGNQYPWGEPGLGFSLSPLGSYSFGDVTSNYDNDTYFRYRVDQSDVGAGDKFNGTWQFAPEICQSTSWGPWDGTRPVGEWKPSSAACVRVPYNFGLTPSIGDLGMEVGDQDGTVPTVSAIVTNSGPTKSYKDVHWQLSRIIVKAGNTIPNGADNKQTGCTYYGNACTTTDGNGSGSGDSSFGVGATTVSQLTNQPIGDLEVGDRLCYGMSVMAYKRDIDNSSGNWRHSAPRCVIVGKKPKVQVWGSDLSVGRQFSNDMSTPADSNVDVSTSVKSNNTKVFGSWVEYGVFASGTITSGSAAGLAGQDGHGPGAQLDWSKLTFANGGHTAASGCNGIVKFGCYAKADSMGTIPDVAARLAPGTAGTPLSGSISLDGRNDTYYASGDVRITGGTIEKGRSVVIKSAGTVFIDGDIRYTGDTLSSMDEIPQVVIIANSIQVKDSVTNVDAWLIANGAQGSIHTCDNRTFTTAPVLTSKLCDKALTINGPVMAKKLYLTRTAGSGTGTASGEPAEILNLRTDAYLWAITRSGGEGSAQTIDTRELAPRF